MTQTTQIIKRWRYYCLGCTGRVLYAPSPYRFTYAVCPTCGKITDDTNYSDENWLPMSEEEILEKNNLKTL